MNTMMTLIMIIMLMMIMIITMRMTMIMMLMMIMTTDYNDDDHAGVRCRYPQEPLPLRPWRSREHQLQVRNILPKIVMRNTHFEQSGTKFDTFD